MSKLISILILIRNLIGLILHVSLQHILILLARLQTYNFRTLLFRVIVLVWILIFLDSVDLFLCLYLYL